MIGSSGHKWGVESQPSGRDTPLEGRCWNYPWYKSVGSILNVACTSEILTVDGWGQNVPWLCKTFWSAAYDTSCRTENKHIFYFIPTILKSTCLNVKTSNNIYRLILFSTSFCILIQLNESDHFTKGDIEYTAWSCLFNFLGRGDDSVCVSAEWWVVINACVCIYDWAGREETSFSSVWPPHGLLAHAAVIWRYVTSPHSNLTIKLRS